MKKHPARMSRPSEGPTPRFIEQRVVLLMEVIVVLKYGLRELVVSGMQGTQGTARR